MHVFWVERGAVMAVRGQNDVIAFLDPVGIELPVTAPALLDSFIDIFCSKNNDSIHSYAPFHLMHGYIIGNIICFVNILLFIVLFFILPSYRER
jgi:hypothetical protein